MEGSDPGRPIVGTFQRVPEYFKPKLAKAASEEELLRVLARLLREWFTAEQVVIYLTGADGELGSYLSDTRWKGYTAVPTALDLKDLDDEASPNVRTLSGAELGIDELAELQFIRAPLTLTEARDGLVEVRKDMWGSEWTERHADFLAEAAGFVSEHLARMAESSK